LSHILRVINSLGNLKAMAHNRRVLNGESSNFIVAVLRERQVTQGWTLDELQKRSGIPRTTIHGALRGRALSVQTFIDLAINMDLDPSALVAEAVRQRPPGT